MNNKGITLVTVVVMIIIIIIIATVSILSGNRLTTGAKNYKDAHNLEAVRMAILERKSRVEMQGSITPLGESYPGFLSPHISPDNIECTNWYMLNKESLKELGQTSVEAQYLVNYDKGIVLAYDDPDYVENYLVYEFMEKDIQRKKNEPHFEYIGEELEDYSYGNTGKSYYRVVENDAKEVFAKGWYRVTYAEMIEEIEADHTGIDLSKYLKNDYLVNYEDYKIVKFTDDLIPG